MEDYTYVGFGSIYFTDFILFHKTLGLSQMVSIEQDGTNSARFLWNKPYDFIQMHFAPSNVALQRIDWRRPVILWLDYDGKLDTNVLEDIRIFVNRASSRSILFLSANVKLDSSLEPSEVRQSFTESVGADAAAPFQERDFRTGVFPSTCVKTINNQVNALISIRNTSATPGKELVSKDLATFEYQDDARMLTVAKIILTEEDQERLPICNLEALGFCKGNEIFSIDPPNLTLREMRQLDTLLPDYNGDWIREKKIPIKDAERYRIIYRYFPMFADVDV